jgi:uncharacterized protein (DUF427 family)
LGANPAGRFSAPVPSGVVYVEPFRRRVRGVRNGAALVDSERVVLVHRPGGSPVYAFPSADVRGVATEPEPELDGYVRVAWNAVDEWYEEGERVPGHPRNPYHRIDILRSNRRLQVEVAGVTIVDTDDTVVLYETALDPKLYVDRGVVHDAELVPSETVTFCPYKGTTTYWNAIVGEHTVRDVAWSYEDPYPESLPIKGLLSFEPGHVTLAHDLPPPAF